MCDIIIKSEYFVYRRDTMKLCDIERIFNETAYVRMGGSPQELKCAEYLVDECKKLGLDAGIEAFDVPMATIKEAHLYCDGEEITCKGYLCCGSGEVEAPLYYLTNSSKYALSQCRGKIVMIDGYLGYWMYQDLLENGSGLYYL